MRAFRICVSTEELAACARSCGRTYYDETALGNRRLPAGGPPVGDDAADFVPGALADHVALAPFAGVGQDDGIFRVLDDRALAFDDELVGVRRAPGIKPSYGKERPLAVILAEVRHGLRPDQQAGSGIDKSNL